METLLVLIMLVLVLDIAALRRGFDSTEEIGSPEWERRATWHVDIAGSDPDNSERKQMLGSVYHWNRKVE